MTVAVVKMAQNFGDGGSFGDFCFFPPPFFDGLFKKEKYEFQCSHSERVL